MSYARLPPLALGFDLKAEAAKACDESADSDIAKAMCQCARQFKADREHFKQCAAAAASIAAAGYCTAQTGSPQLGALCGEIAGFIAGPVAGAIYDAGDALATGIKDLFGSDDDNPCGCDKCYWDKCWSQLTEAQKLQFCTMPQHQRDWAGAGRPGDTCADVRLRETAGRADAVTRMNAAYVLWVKSMVKVLNDKLLPQLLALGQNVRPFTGDYIEQKLATHMLTPSSVAAASGGFFAQAAGQMVGGTALAPLNASKAERMQYGWFQRTGWDAPVRYASIIADPRAVERAAYWGRQLSIAEPLVAADILSDIARSVRLATRKQLTDFTAQKRAAQQNAALLGAGVLLTGAALAGIVIYRRRSKKK